MFKKQRKIAPYFQTHPPFNAVTGQYASLTGELGVSPYCVLMQVAAEDTYADYVICRGFDTRMLVFVDYEAGNSDKPGISVAKPYGNRKTGTYEIGEIYPALLPVQGNATYTPPSPAEINLRLGQNPGVVDGTPEAGGQPSDLDASLILLYDHNGIAVNWLMIDGGASRNCDELKPGTYSGYAAIAIAPGDTGSVLVQDCDTAVFVNAKNHTNCLFQAGHPVTVTVDRCCGITFTGCQCCDGTEVPEEPECCDKIFGVCVGGQSVLMSGNNLPGAPNTQLISFNLNRCCGVDVQTPWSIVQVYVSVQCQSNNPGIPYEVTAYVTVTTLGGIREYVFDWSNICDDPMTNSTESIVIARNHPGDPLGSAFGFDCDAYITSGLPSSALCIDCPESPPPDEECCNKFLWFCINGDSQQLSVNGGSYDFDVTACCSECTTAELRIANTCNSESANPLSLNWSCWCDGIQIDAGAVNISEFCTSNDPVIHNFNTLPCFLQLQMSIGNTPCDPCTSSDPCYDPADCVSTACCVDPVPKSLTMVVVGGACAGTYSLVWSSGSTWQDVGYACSAIELVCTGGVWTMSVDMIGITLISAICDPLEIVFDGSLVGLTSVTVTA